MSRLLSFHLIPNAHLDPVWLWDWREGLNEGITTSRTVLDLMDEYEDLTFIRGEAAIYQHIEEHDPETFKRIRKRVSEGRWDVVGGTCVQSDNNMPATETLVRHFVRAQGYFRSRFGRTARVAWAADSFGHSAGLPEILASAGITGFAFTRPPPRSLPIAKPAFWWEGSGGRRVMAYRPQTDWYGTERNEISARMDRVLNAALKSDMENVGVFIGLGNHGGGPTRRMLNDIWHWAEQHPEVRVAFSGLHRLFEALRMEVTRKGESFLPVHRGELNFFGRGCYASVAKFKFAFRRTEADLLRAERVDAAVGAAMGNNASHLGRAWDAVLLNTFHDILPGSSIERAYDDQLAQLAGVRHKAQRVEFEALMRLAARVDTRVARPKGDHPCAIPFLIFNPHPYEYRGHVELEACVDYRPVWAYTDKVDSLPLEVRGAGGKALPFQVIATEHSSYRNLAWRKRVIVPVILPPTGWYAAQLAWVEGAAQPTLAGGATAPRKGVIDNGTYRVEAAKGKRGIRIFLHGKPVFKSPGLSAVTVEDTWGSWGGMNDEPEAFNLSKVLHAWRIDAVETLERGPERAMIWVRMSGGSSKMDLHVSLCRERKAVDVAVRVMWNEDGARLKLVMPAGEKAEFEVPGGTVERGPAGEVPGGRWVRIKGPRGSFGFTSDALYCFDCRKGEFRATIVRASRYAHDARTTEYPEPWRPVVDAGEIKFRFAITPGDRQLPGIAGELEQPPVAIQVPPAMGILPRSGSLFALNHLSLRLLALKPAEDGRSWIVRLQETSGRATKGGMVWMGRRMDLGVVPAWRIATWKITSSPKGWKAYEVSSLEAGR